MRWKVSALIIFLLVLAKLSYATPLPMSIYSQDFTCNSYKVTLSGANFYYYLADNKLYMCQETTRVSSPVSESTTSYIDYITIQAKNSDPWYYWANWASEWRSLTRPATCAPGSCTYIVVLAHRYGYNFQDWELNCSVFDAPDAQYYIADVSFPVFGYCNEPVLSINSSYLSDRYHFIFNINDSSSNNGNQWYCDFKFNGSQNFHEENFTSNRTIDLMYTSFPNQTATASITCNYKTSYTSWTIFDDESWQINSISVNIISPSNGDNFTIGTDPITVNYEIGGGTFDFYNTVLEVDGVNVSTDSVPGGELESFTFNKTLGNKTITVYASNDSYSNSSTIGIAVNPVVVTGGSGGNPGGNYPPLTANTTSPPPGIFGPGVTPLPPITITTDQYVIIISPGGYNVSMAKLENFEDNLYVKNMGTSSVNIQFSTLSKYMAFVGVSPTSLVISPGSNVSFRVKAGGFTDEGYFEVPIAVLVNGEDKATAHIDATIKGEGSLLSLLFGGATSSLLGLFSAKITIPFIEFSITPIFLILVALAYYTGTTARIDGKWNKFYIVVVAAVLIVIFDMKLIFP